MMLYYACKFEDRRWRTKTKKAEGMIIPIAVILLLLLLRNAFQVLPDDGNSTAARNTTTAAYFTAQIAPTLAAQSAKSGSSVQPNDGRRR